MREKKQDGRDSKFEVPGSMFRIPRTSHLEPSSASIFPPVSRVLGDDTTRQGKDGEVDCYGEIRPGVENL
jgi:hypothetical protein